MLEVAIMFLASFGFYILISKILPKLVKKQALQKTILGGVLIFLLILNAFIDVAFKQEVTIFVPVAFLIMAFYLYHKAIESKSRNQKIFHYSVMLFSAFMTYNVNPSTDDFALDCKSDTNIIAHFAAFKGHNIFVINSEGKENTYEFGKPKEVDQNFKSYYYWGTKDYLCEAYLKSEDCGADIKIDRNTLDLTLINKPWKHAVNTDKNHDRGHLDSGEDFKCTKVDEKILREYYTDLKDISEAGIKKFTIEAENFKKMKEKEESEKQNQIEKDKKI